MRGTPYQISLSLRRRAEALDRAIREAERESVAEALALARHLSSGAYTSAMLKAMGHPYSAVRPMPPADPSVINRQTGAFYSGWRVIGPRKTHAGLSTRLVNSAPHARFLLAGTRRMIPRPILAAIRAGVAKNRARRHRQAIRQLHSGG